MASVRYIVDDVDAALEFYCRQLGFHEDMHPTHTFAMLSHGTCGSYSARPEVGRAAGKQCPTDGCPRQEGGSLPVRGRGHRGGRRSAAQARRPLPQRHRRQRRR
jgi:catechol 2,3-dioxygenase-like lactoylglutathione lyase family enzyme